MQYGVLCSGVFLDGDNTIYFLSGILLQPKFKQPHAVAQHVRRSRHMLTQELVKFPGVGRARMDLLLYQIIFDPDNFKWFDFVDLKTIFMMYAHYAKSKKQIASIFEVSTRVLPAAIYLLNMYICIYLSNVCLLIMHRLTKSVSSNCAKKANS